VTAIKEESHASIANRGAASQRGETRTHKISLIQLWQTLPEETRQRTFITLRRIVTQQVQLVQPPLEGREVQHEVY
jgi:hypothetical protein